MKSIIIIQARMGSHRLPGKVMMKINEKPLLHYLINQIKNCKNKEIIVATSILKDDDVIENYAKKMGVNTFRGSENDVLDRFYKCAKNYNCDAIIRISADSPLLDYQIVEKCISKFESNYFDYCSNTIKKYNDKWIEHFNGFPKGYAVEIIRFTALEKAWKESISHSDREHVTEYIWHNPQKFQLGNFEHSDDLSNIRLVVDYPNDFKLIKKIIESFPENTIFSLDDVITFLKNNLNLTKINSELL